jgi:hypothetical protein
MRLTRAFRISETKASDGVLEGLIPVSVVMCEGRGQSPLVSLHNRFFPSCILLLPARPASHPARALTHSRNLYTRSTYLWYRA